MTGSLILRDGSKFSQERKASGYGDVVIAMRNRLRNPGRASHIRKRVRLTLLILASVIAAFAVVAGISAIVCSFSLCVSEYDVKIDGIEHPFRAVLLTDLHDKQYGPDNERLLDRVRAQNPDVIFSVGDMINEDASDEEVERFVVLLTRLREISPVYVSYGNHEQKYLAGGGQDLAPRIEQTGAVLLDETCVTAEIAGNTVCIGGTLGHLYPFGRTQEEFMDSPEVRLMQEMQASGLPTIVLAHLPDTIIFVEAYKEWDMDLFLSGHTHGGVIRLPFVGGLYAPMQGWLPEFDRGYFNPGKIQLIISGGLAGHGWIPRIFNRPEITVVDIHGS